MATNPPAPVQPNPLPPVLPQEPLPTREAMRAEELKLISAQVNEFIKTAFVKEIGKLSEDFAHKLPSLESVPERLNSLELAIQTGHAAAAEPHKARAEKLFKGLLDAQHALGEIEQLPDHSADHRGWMARTAIANISAVLGE